MEKRRNVFVASSPLGLPPSHLRPPKRERSLDRTRGWEKEKGAKRGGEREKKRFKFGFLRSFSLCSAVPSPPPRLLPTPPSNSTFLPSPLLSIRKSH